MGKILRSFFGVDDEGQLPRLAGHWCQCIDVPHVGALAPVRIAKLAEKVAKLNVSGGWFVLPRFDRAVQIVINDRSCACRDAQHLFAQLGNLQRPG